MYNYLMNYLTFNLSNDMLILGILVFLAIWQVGKSVLRYMAPRTDTSLDDKLSALIDRLEGKTKQVSESDFVREFSPKIWAGIESMSRIDASGAGVLSGMQKLAAALVTIHNAWIAASGKTLSGDGIKLFEAEMARLSQEAKK